MGQYWKAVINKFAYSPRDYGGMNKLMEHSFIGNDFVGHICLKIQDCPSRVVWVGDYSDIEDIKEHKNKVFLRVSQSCNKYTIDLSKDTVDMRRGYLINVDKKEYVSLYDYCIRADSEMGIVNPLPLLTAFPKANGKGGGDYFGSDIEYIGYWSGDRILFSYSEDKIDGLQEIIPIFIETR